MRREINIAFLLITLGFSVAALAQLFPLIQARTPVVAPVADTNHYHLTFIWDAVSNASWYSIIVRSNGTEVQRRYSMTNTLTISNIIGSLDAYRFTATATNSIGESDESLPAPLHLSVVQASNDLTNWLNAPSVVFDPTTNARQFLRLTNFDAERYLQKD